MCFGVSEQPRQALQARPATSRHDQFNIISLFQSYSLATIGYRLMTFNDCENASAELMKVRTFLHVVFYALAITITSKGRTI